MDTNDIFHIAIAPPSSCTPNIIKKIAEIIERPVYDTRLLLIGDIPRIIAHYNDEQIAIPIANRLNDLGCIALVCRDSELRRLPNYFKVHNLELGNDFILFYEINGNQKLVEFNNITLIIKTNLQTQTDIEKTETTIKLSLSKTVLMGGLPMFDKVKKQKKETSTAIENCLRIYEGKTFNSVPEIKQHYVDYSFLGNEITPYSAENFNILITKLREKSPKATFDERLSKSTVEHGPLSQLRNDPEINCKLIVLFHNIMRDQIQNPEDTDAK